MSNHEKDVKSKIRGVVPSKKNEKEKIRGVVRPLFWKYELKYTLEREYRLKSIFLS